MSHIARPNPMIPAFLEAMRSLGFKRCEDFNGPDPEGYGPRQGTIRNGRRDSTAVAYLRPARARSNLEVRTDSLVTRVLLENGRAAGVEVERAGQLQRLQARREVVVCAGAVQSPQILHALRHRRRRSAARARHRDPAPPARGRRELP